MLEIINNLKPFFENCYDRISVRQYARLVRISPPTASSLLKRFEKDGLLMKEKDRNYIMFSANKKGKDFIMLSRIYWQKRLGELTEAAEESGATAAVLFGSLSKAEARSESDIDLAVFGSEKINLKQFEEKIGREIHAFWYDSMKDTGELRNNIINGHILSGELKWKK